MRTPDYYNNKLRGIVKVVERQPSRQAKRATVRTLGLSWKEYKFLLNEAKKRGLLPTAFDGNRKGGVVAIK